MFDEVMAGLSFPECPRWDGKSAWFVDRDGGRVYRMDTGCEPVVHAAVGPMGMGLGFTGDGTPLVVSMADRKLYRIPAPDELVEHADLSALVDHPLNDMLVTAQDRAYVGNLGFDLMRGAAPATTRLAVVEPDGSARLEGPELLLPNGMAMTPDGGTVIVAESFRGVLTAIDVHGDGSLGRHRLFFADLSEVHGHPDGLCIDDEGAVWFADTMSHHVVRVSPSGRVVDQIEVPARHATACALVGEDRKTLLITVTDHLSPDEATTHRTGRVLAMAVPG